MYCRILEVSAQGYKKYIDSLTKPYKYAKLLADMDKILAEDEFNKNYGKKRMYEKLILDYECVHSYGTVAKVMRENGMLHAKNTPKGLTKADKMAQKSDNLINRGFTADEPNKKLVTDITELAGCDGKVYVSAVFDCFDNACLGLSMDSSMRAELVVDSYNVAAGQYNLNGAISHSDRGKQYTSELFRKTLKSLKIVQSMNSAAGRCHDNAKCESMWARGKEEIKALYDIKKMTCEQIKLVVFRYYLGYWNNRRICSAIGGVPPLMKRGAFYEKDSDIAA